MPIKLKPLDKIVEKWTTRATGAAADYAAGLTMPKQPWSAAAVAAKDAWRTGVTDAAGRDAYAKGVTKVGDAKWLRKASEIGVRRYPDGVSAAKDDYKTGFAPVYETETKLDLPPRGPRGDPKNIERVRIVMTALRQLKTSAGK